MKKILAMMLTAAMMLSMGTAAMAATINGSIGVQTKDDGEDFISVELDGTPNEDYVVVLFSGDTELIAATPKCACEGPHTCGFYGIDEYLTCKFMLEDGGSESWNYERNEDAITIDNVPTKVVLYTINSDDSRTEVDTCDISDVVTAEAWREALQDADIFYDEDIVIVKKTYNVTNTGTASPAETFTFTDIECDNVTNGGYIEVENETTGETESVVVDKNTAPVPTIGSVTYDEGEAGSETATKNIEINLPEYEAVGIYTYTFTEVDNGIAGVTYFNGDITLVVTVIEQDGQIRVAAVHTESLVSPSYNENTTKNDTFENEYSAGSLSIEKTVTGILGDKEKEFEVTVNFESDKPVHSTVTYYDVDTATTADDGTTSYEEETLKWTDEKNEDDKYTASATFTLNHGETLTFENLPYGVTYTVVETNYTDENNTVEANKLGYDAAVYMVTNKELTTPTKTNEGSIGLSSETVTITNNKDGEVDTGISVDSIPYIAMLGVVAIGGTGFIVSKKRRSED